MKKNYKEINKTLIQELSDEHIAFADKYYEDGVKYGKRTIKSLDELNKDKIKEAIGFFYSFILKLNAPEILYASGPMDAHNILSKYVPKESDRRNFSIYYTSQDTHWTQNYLYFVDLVKTFPNDFGDVVINNLNNEFMTQTFATQWVNFNREIYGVVLGIEKCIVIAYPSSYAFDTEHRLCNFNSESFSFLDGTKLYFIDGIEVPEEIVTTPIDKITKEFLLSIVNVDHRRCLIKRLGPKKTIEILGAVVLDKKTFPVGGTYELLGIKLDNEISNQMMPYLKMTNPSINEVHIEGVGADCKTVEEAIMYRNGLKTFILPEHLS